MQIQRYCLRLELVGQAQRVLSCRRHDAFETTVTRHLEQDMCEPHIIFNNEQDVVFRLCAVAIVLYSASRNGLNSIRLFDGESRFCNRLYSWLWRRRLSSR